MRRIRPDVLLLAELELWPNLVWAARRHGARTAVINGRLSQAELQGLSPHPAARLSVAAKDRLHRRAGRNLCRTIPRPGGQTGSGPDHGFHEVRRRPDRSRQPRHAPLGRIGWTGRGRCGLSRRQHPGARGVGGPASFPAIEPRLAPAASDHRAPASGTVRRRRADAGRLRRSLAAPHVARIRGTSSAQASAVPPRLTPTARVLLVDVVGELGAWWGTAHVAFVGGSLGNRGGQNMIEPAAYGAAVSFGPNTRNFRDIVAALLQHDAAVVVADAAQLLAFVRDCLANPTAAAARGQRATNLVRQQTRGHAADVSVAPSVGYRPAPRYRWRSSRRVTSFHMENGLQTRLRSKRRPMIEKRV